MKISVVAISILMAVLLGGCTYALRVTHEPGLEPQKVILMKQVKIGVLKTDDYLLQGGVEKLRRNSDISEIKTNYQAESNLQIDYIYKLQRKVRYRSSGENFFITFPGFLVFAPAVFGYKYYIDIATVATLMDKDGEVLSTSVIKTPYEIRYTSYERGSAVTMIGWLVPLIISPLNIITGMVYSSTCDLRARDEFYDAIKDSYSSTIASHLLRQIQQEQNKTSFKHSEYESIPIIVSMDKKEVVLW